MVEHVAERMKCRIAGGLDEKVGIILCAAEAADTEDVVAKGIRSVECKELFLEYALSRLRWFRRSQSVAMVGWRCGWWLVVWHWWWLGGGNA